MGAAFPISQRFTVDHVTHKMCAKSSCDNPSAFRILRIRLGVMLIKVRLLLERKRGKDVCNGTPSPSFRSLEVETDGASDRARRDVVRATEGGKEVVERDVVGQVDHFHASAEFVAVVMEVEDVIVANG